MSPNSRCSNLGRCQPRAMIMSSLTLTYLADKGTDNGNYIPFQSIQEALCVDTHRNIIYSIFMGKVKVCDRPEDSFTSQIDNMRKAAVRVVRWSCTAVHCKITHRMRCFVLLKCIWRRKSSFSRDERRVSLFDALSSVTHPIYYAREMIQTDTNIFSIPLWLCSVGREYVERQQLSARHHDALECSENQLGLHEGWVLFLAHSQMRKPGSNGLSPPWMASSLDLTKCPSWMRSCQVNPIAACNQAWSTTRIWRLHTCIASTNWSK